MQFTECIITEHVHITNDKPTDDLLFYFDKPTDDLLFYFDKPTDKLRGG